MSIQFIFERHSVITSKQTSIANFSKIMGNQVGGLDALHTAVIVKRGLESKDNSDRVFLVSGVDGQKIPIHRFILSASSKYFADLVHKNDSDMKQREFILADSDGETIKTVVDYCYSGNIELTEQNAVKCLQIAVNEEFDLLLAKCLEYYSTKLTAENAVQVLMVADKHNIDDLWQGILEVIGSKIDEVPMADIVQLKPSMMQRLLETGEKKELIVERLIKWFQHDEDGRGEHMPKMLRLVQLDQLRVQFLTETIEPIFVQFKCFDQLAKEYKRRTINCACESLFDRNAPSKTVQSSQMGNDMKTVFIVCVRVSDTTQMTVYSHVLLKEGYVSRISEPYFTSPNIDVFGSGTVLYANKLFVIGGRRQDQIGKTLDSMIAFDLKTGKKTRLASMDEPRCDFTSIVLGKRIYVFGGRNKSVWCSSSCERYDIETNKWETIKSMNHPRGIVSAVILKGVIYVASAFHRNYTSIESYNPKTNEWTVRKSLDGARNGAQLVVFNGILYGFVDMKFNRYDLKKDEWTEMDGRSLFRNCLAFTFNVQEMIAVNNSLFAITNDETLQQLKIDENEMEMVIEKVATVPVLPGSVSIQRMG